MRHTEKWASFMSTPENPAEAGLEQTQRKSLLNEWMNEGMNEWGTKELKLLKGTVYILRPISFTYSSTHMRWVHMCTPLCAWLRPGEGQILDWVKCRSCLPSCGSRAWIKSSEPSTSVPIATAGFFVHLGESDQRARLRKREVWE